MLKAADIHKSYDTLKVLKGVSLEVKQGEIVSIVGASGAGKTTLLQILGTLDDMDQGFLEINNTRIEAKPKVDLKPVKWYHRFMNFFIDNLVILIFASIIIGASSNLLGPDTEGAFVPFLNAIVPAIVLYIAPIFISVLYYLSMEFLTGRTLGKYITGTKVIIKNEGTKPGFSHIVGRTFIRLVPFEWVTFFSKRPEGWHDSVSNTQVVKDEAPYQVLPEHSLTDEELSVFRNKNIGFIFQFHNLLPEFTALENVCIPGYLGGKEDELIKKRAFELLELLGLKDRVDHKPSQLSGGEQQRVAIARALINEPGIVFADEPSGNLDSQNAEELHKLFFKLRETLNQTFIIVTHNEKLAEMADRKLVMADGKMIS